MPARLTITFHGIGDPVRPIDEDEAEVWLPVDWLETVVGAADEQVQITFDDGNASDLERALPVLTSAGRKATFFVLAGRLGEPGYLHPDGVGALQAAGMTIGSHGLHHRPWRRLDDAELRRELVESRRILEDIIGQPVQDAACPFGSYDRRVVAAVRRAGYRHVYTSDGGAARTGTSPMPRTTIDRRRPLPEWTALVETPSHPGAGPVQRAKRLVKRWR
jgi:peptidoglycan/xylan/chitin deacetylase (PgdA/CDA1 family)